MENIAIYGAGGFGREVACLIHAINEISPIWNLIGFFDDGISKEMIVNGIPVLGGIKEMNAWNEKLNLVLAVGAPVMRKNLFMQINNSFISYPTLIHPSVLIGDLRFVNIGIGCIICARVIITVNVKIDDFVILNLDCTIGHDSNIGKYTSFMPTVNLSGEVEVGEEVYIGTGAKVINLLTIGTGTIVGAGAVVVKSLPANCTAVGVPAKPIKFHGENIIV